MMRILSTRVLFSFSVKNKTQNFFDMNPVYPDFGEKNFDIYNSERKTVPVIDEYIKSEEQRIRMRTVARHHLFLKKYDKFRRTSGKVANYKIDKETSLPIGMDSDFDDFVRLFRRDKFLDKNAKGEFKETLTRLIHKFKCKSEVELLKLFRISIANSRKRTLLDKLRGGVIEEAILRTAQHMKSFELFKKDKSTANENEDEDEKHFSKILNDLDKHIEEVENTLIYHPNGVPKVLSDYDPKYGWKETKEITPNQNFNIDTHADVYEKVTYSSEPAFGENYQDWSIKSHINRLYFLRRLEYLKNNKTFNEDLFVQNLPINVSEKLKVMNELAHKYKEEELIQVPDLEDIYRDVDALINNVFINVRSDKKRGGTEQEEIYDRSPEQKEFLWENISAEEILCDTMYNTDSVQNIELTQETLYDVSPSSHTELTLSKFPVNLYRHSELDCFGIFNEYRSKLSKGLLSASEIDFEPSFKEFSVEVAERRYNKIQREAALRTTSSFGVATRKTALAQVHVKKGTGIVTINGEPIQDYFGDVFFRVETLKPLVFTDTSGQYNLRFKVTGGGQHGQSECMAYALAKALIKINPEHERILYKFGLVGSDFRKKEPKKLNLYSARVKPPYVRR